MPSSKYLIWFYKDLRIHDNQFFDWLSNQNCECTAIVFKPQNKSEIQLKFFWQSVLSIKNSLKKLNINLHISGGNPMMDIPQLAEENKIDFVLASKVYNSRDHKVMQAVQNQLTNSKLILFEQSTLLVESNLPFVLENMPTVFTEFRNKVEKKFEVKPLVAPDFKNVKFKSFILKNIISEIIPQNILCTSDSPENTDCISISKMGFQFIGGENFAQKRIADYFYNSKSLSTYKETRNGMLFINESSKFSPWLALGCVSARQLYYEIKKYEETHGANESTYWLVFELLWRDYFKFLGAKIGSQLFDEQGIRSIKMNSRSDKNQIYRWTNGQTGVDFVDANMRELLLTGWMSNRGRQNVASYFSKIENMNWTLGAKWFEANLIDDDTESNWGNWLYVSGAGTDPRDRHFNIERQASIYDANFQYRKKWLNN